MASQPQTFLPYHEPSILTILILASFLLLLNALNKLFDALLSCGLIAQILLGVIYGTPLAQLLSPEAELTIVQLGYLGLLLLVYEGGLSTNFPSLKANLLLSVLVAITGIAVPIALSFVLQRLLHASPLQAFAAGAALCSTSLGTTFTLLGTSGLARSRLGVVLSSAAMMDDVVGLVMVQVISNLGSVGTGFDAVTVVRPLAVSVGLGVAVLVVCRFVVGPVTLVLNRRREGARGGALDRIFGGEYSAPVLHSGVLVGLITGASYAGTSNLFAAYLAGAAVSWWDSEMSHLAAVERSERAIPLESSGTVAQDGNTVDVPTTTRSDRAMNARTINEFASTGTAVYEQYYEAATRQILQPFFFASIGFAIPVREMFRGDIVWKGIIYTILMLFGKLVTGIWLVRLNLSFPALKAKGFWTSRQKKEPQDGPNESHELQSITENLQSKNEQRTPDEATAPSVVEPPTPRATPPPVLKTLRKDNPKPLSLYPAAILGTAMMSRGEIGFLIASLAETKGVFGSSGEENGSSEIYLVVVWAVVLCTIIGPVSMGVLVGRVRRLGKEREDEGVRGPLGVWGVG